MQLLDDVYELYPATVSSGEKVDGRRATPDVLAVTRELPALFSDALGERADSDHFKVRASVGQRNWGYARIPWIAVLDDRLTSSPERGYFCVLLFKQDMSGCFLSLNQGYTQYREAFGTDSIARRRIELTARECARFLNVQSPYVSGPIDLAAEGRLGKGYEGGAIASKFYSRQANVTEAELQADLLVLLELQDRLTARVGGNILNFLPTTSDQEFQEAANSLAQAGEEEDLPDGPAARPGQKERGGRKGYGRNPKVASRALRLGGFQCAVDPAHRSFVTRRTSHQFVEAHHLIPMGRQAEFEYSLDVPENILALCPNCHRFVHHGKSAEVKPLLHSLLASRHSLLRGRGLNITAGTLESYYSCELAEDD